jgi:hypothetical protein
MKSLYSLFILCSFIALTSFSYSNELWKKTEKFEKNSGINDIIATDFVLNF